LLSFTLDLVPRNPEFTSFEAFTDDFSAPFALNPDTTRLQNFEERNPSRNSRKNKVFGPPEIQNRITRGMIVDWKAAHHYDKYDADPVVEDPGQLVVDKLHDIYGGEPLPTGPVPNVYAIFDKVPAKSMTEVRLRNSINREHTMLAGTEYVPANTGDDD
jgi:hypothetical protein